MSIRDIVINFCSGYIFVFVCRIFFKIYNQIWRYGGIQGYMKLLFSDMLSMCIYIGFEYVGSGLFNFQRFSISKLVALTAFDALVVLGMRMSYRYCFKYGNELNARGKILRALLRIFALGVSVKKDDNFHKIYVAIVGAGNVGVSLAEELLTNKNSSYTPMCFFDTNNC
jgi:FlaA1/EpsC-like NDP-sugar epimerase